MPSVTGRVSASFVEAEGRTRIDERAHMYPLKLAKAFPFDGGQLGIYVMDASPGIMSGDHYELSWRFGRNTNVFITNQSYTKVHPAKITADEAMCGDSGMYSGLPVSEQKQTLFLEQGSYVEYMPEPLMLYKDAVFSSDTEVCMEPGSTLILTDAVCPGRTQRGEIFQYSLYQSKLSVVYNDELIYIGKQRIKPAVCKLEDIGSWAGYTHCGALYLFSEQADTGLAERLREFAEEALLAAAEATGRRLYAGVSRTYKHGLILSVMGHKIYEIQHLLEAAWQWLRQTLFQKPPLQVRK